MIQMTIYWALKVKKKIKKKLKLKNKKAKMNNYLKNTRTVQYALNNIKMVKM